MSFDNEKNAVEYLHRRLLRYYSEIEIAFIDSRCSDYLQLADVFIRVFGEKLLDNNDKYNGYSSDFIKSKNFT